MGTAHNHYAATGALLLWISGLFSMIFYAKILVRCFKLSLFYPDAKLGALEIKAKPREMRAITQ